MTVIVTVLLIVAAVGGVVYLLNGQRGFAACSGVVGAGWVIPLLAAALIGTVLWLLSSEDPKLTDVQDDDLTSEQCPACGESVLSSWRLCPGCGTRLDDSIGVS